MPSGSLTSPQPTSCAKNRMVEASKPSLSNYKNLNSFYANSSTINNPVNPIPLNTSNVALNRSKTKSKTSIYVPALGSRLENISRSSTQSNNSLGNSIPVRITNLPYQAYNHYLKGVNYKNLSYIRCTNNQQSGFVPIDFCLLNTRSINNKELVIKDYVVERDIDILAVTETWLRDDDKFSVAEVCPMGYYFYHVSRKNSRGGGVGLLLKKRIQVKRQTQEKFISFEYIDIVAKCSTGSTRIITIYRPPPSKANQMNSSLFFEEFCTLAEELVVSPGNLLIVGDFNYHIDNISKSDTIKFNKILESFNLQQHVNGPTHKKGHTLDLIITRAEERLVTSI